VASEEDTQWTAESRRRFAIEVEALVDAVRRHGAEVLALTGRQADLQVVFRAGADLARAARSYADAQFDLTGTIPTFDPDLEDEDEDDEDEDVFADASARLLLVHRAEYAVTDPDAVLAAGRAAYRRVWPDDTEQDAAVDVTSVGRALYQVQHDGGLSALDRVPGLEEVESSTWHLDAADEDGRREVLRSALGSVGDHGHEWDGDPAAWVREQRSGEGQG
jgi:hypothetical protein